MDIFVELEVKQVTGDTARRLFNVNYVESIDVNSSTVLLHGKMKPFAVTDDSMGRLLSVLRKKGVVHERK